MKRCIMIFPKFDNREVIKEIRKKYDPVVKFVREHVTLVFPFESDIKTEDLKQHIIEVSKDIKPFRVSLQGITSEESFKNWIFINVVGGVEPLTKLHNNLYTGILEKYRPEWLSHTSFLPHMTVGNLDSKKELFKAIADLEGVRDCFSAMVTEISVEIIDADSNGSLEFTVGLK